MEIIMHQAGRNCLEVYRWEWEAKNTLFPQETPVNPRRLLVLVPVLGLVLGLGLVLVLVLVLGLGLVQVLARVARQNLGVPPAS